MTSRTRAPVRAGLRRRARRAKLRTGVAVLLAVCVVLVGGGYTFFRHQLSRLSRLHIPNLTEDDESGVMNLVLVGSDSRENTSGDIADATGKGDEGSAGQRSDTIMVLHIDPEQRRAAILSIPRDLYVPIPGQGGRDRINASYAIGGPELLIETIQEALGIDINHYVEIDFRGVERIVNAVGGVRVDVDAPARDSYTGLDISSAGCVELDGYQALAFVRSRHYETWEQERWVPGSGSDIDRISRQQDFIRRMLKKAVSSGLGNPLTLNRLIGIGVENVTVDQQMSTKDITTLARRFRSLDPEAVDMLTLPTTDAFISGADVQLLDATKAPQMLDRLNGISPTTSPLKPEDVTVNVLNGNGGEAAASMAATSLGHMGFRVASTGDASTYDYAETVVRFAPGRQAEAELLSRVLAAGAAVEEDRSLAGADVTLILGVDYTGLRTAAPASGASTSAAVLDSSEAPKAPAAYC